MSAPPEFLTVAEMCISYRIGRTTLYREVAAGRLRLRKLGVATRIARADAEAWAANLPTNEGEAA
jgi:excisionase family DNA binding protein